MKTKNEIQIQKRAVSKDLALRRSGRRISGQSLVEYVLLMFFLTSMSISIMRVMTRVTQDGFQTMAAELEKSLITGSFDFNGQDIHQTGWAR